MHFDAILPPCPLHLEDEAWLIETAGEMPEVALAESRHHLDALDPAELACLQGAAVRGYWRIIVRDLDYAQVGGSAFRGLDRGLQNLLRLKGYLARLGWAWPAESAAELRAMLAAYLDAEAAALAGGRAYASAAAATVADLAAELGLGLAAWPALLANMAALPVPDFRGLSALARLAGAGAAAVAKRRREKDGLATVEVLDAQGQALVRVGLHLMGAAGVEDPELRARLETFWGLVALPEA
ncbi:MAG: hypothetical protein V1797_17665 [Pseudomonadota bacterium]